MEISDGTIITTSIYDLDLHIRDELTIKGKMVIRSFPQSDARYVPSTPNQPPKARRGDSYDRGPKTEGASAASAGADGGKGDHGTMGANGARGYDAGMVTVRIDQNAKASGLLIINEDGGTGGSGGQGGAGGDGGDGQQGGRGKPNYVAGVVAGCASGAGYGGRAGDGNKGGPGGDGGRGGTIIILGGSDTVAKWLESSILTVKGGSAGARGSGGDGRQPGHPGFGGRGSTGCQGEETNRIGNSGTAGPKGDDEPETANPGSDGQIRKF